MEPAVFYSVARRRDSRHGTSVLPFSAWRAAAVSWRVGVLKADGTLDDLAGVSAITLRISSYGGTKPGAFPWVIKTVPAADFTVPSSADAVRANMEWHAEFTLAEEEMLLPVEDGGSRSYWYEISGGGSILAAGQLILRAAGGSGDTRYALTDELALVSGDVDQLASAIAAPIPFPARLREAVMGSSYNLTGNPILRDSDGMVLSSTVLWPDGVTGVFTTTSKDPVHLTVESYTITYNADPIITITQPAIERDPEGNVTKIPGLIIS